MNAFWAGVLEVMSGLLLSACVIIIMGAIIAAALYIDSDRGRK